MLLSRKTDVTLWCFEQETIDEISINQTNCDFLPNIELPSNITPVGDINLLERFDVIINTVPTQFIRNVYSGLNLDWRDKVLINCSKGIEKHTHKLIYEIFFEVLGIDANQYVTFGGPSHAEEVARLMPTAVVASSVNKVLALSVRDFFNSESFRVYSSNDIIGTELGGAMKNVIAIAFGVAVACGVGDNAKAMIISRGLNEIARLGKALRATSDSINGLAGMGDLVVTCYSKHSRNRTVGEL